DVINWNGIKIVLPKDLLEATHTSLAKTALLSRVSIKENKHLCIIGFYLQNPGDLLPHATFFSNELYAKSDDEHYCYYHLGNGFYIFVVKVTEKNIFFQAFSDKNQLLGSLTWHTLRLMNKQINIYPESRGLFLPHRSELHQTPLISFDKGCYKGQEIIARTHYRATLKHELRIYSINSDEPVHSGQKIYPVDEEIELGEVVDYSFLANNRYLIAISILKEAPTTIRLEGQTPSITLESASI
ncbi:MAG: tRNA-modifying protein YgfZ, partial [bacterium]|nr:tRNA-modifying protein YgfZ [bacterium]